MANNNRASYTTIGFTVIIGIVTIVATLVYIGGYRGKRDMIYMETYYDHPVGGLTKGSPVNFRGVRFGEVVDVSFVGIKYPEATGRDVQSIYIKMAVNRRLLGMADLSDAECARHMDEMIKGGLRATVSSNSITGLSRIECDVEDDAQPPEKFAWKPYHIFIPSKISFMETFSVAATKVMNQINSMDIEAVWSNIHATVEAVTVASESLRTMLDARRGDIDQIVNNLNETVSASRDLAVSLRQNPSLLVRERVPEPLPETKR